MVKLRFEVEGIVERADLIGAIFGQTEGLFGPEMNLNELQKAGKVGRIEVNLEPKNDRTHGEVLIPMSTDISTAALIAASVESVDKVGPFAAHFRLEEIEDVRATKKKAIVERAKKIVKEWASKTTSEGEELLKDVAESVRRAKLVSFGPEGLSAGPGVYTSDVVILVEGRADVINLLRAGIENVVALEGARVPDSIIKLSKEKKLVAFLDGDRAANLILKELEQALKLERVVRAPPGREVEDLTPVEILRLLGWEAIDPHKEEPKRDHPEPLSSKVRELYEGLNGTLEAVVLNDEMDQLARIPVNELVQSLEKVDKASYVIFDGIITQRLVDVCSNVGIKAIVGHRTGELSKVPQGIALYTFRDFGLG
ncbi:MAG: DNA primase DnaG [Nitrososphaerota archaeon]